MMPLRFGLLELGNAAESKFLKFQRYSALEVFRIKPIQKSTKTKRI